MKALVENNLKNKQTNKQRKEKEKNAHAQTWITEKLRNISQLNDVIKWQKSHAWVTGDDSRGSTGRRKKTVVNFILPVFLCTQLYIEEETPGNEAGTLGCLYAVT